MRRICLVAVSLVAVSLVVACGQYVPTPPPGSTAGGSAGGSGGGSTAGNDADPGTRAQPKRSIGAGLKQATALGAFAATPKPVPVLVAAGTYGERVVMPDQIDLQGSYDPTWGRNAAAHSSRLILPDGLGVRFSLATMTRTSAKMSGFTVVSPNAAITRALYVSNGTRPTLEDLEVHAGNVTENDGSTVALMIDGAMSRPLLTRSAMVSGNAGHFAYESSDDSDAFTAAIQMKNGGSIELSSSSATSGDSNERPSAVRCDGSCTGSTFTDVTLQSDHGAALMLADGDFSGLTVTRALLKGNRGLWARNCAGTALRIMTTTLTGVTQVLPTPLGYTGSSGAIVDGCQLELRDSHVFGATGVAVTYSTGVSCGAGSTCTLIANEIWGAGPMPPVSRRTVGISALGQLRLERNVIRTGNCWAMNEGEDFSNELTAVGVESFNAVTAANNVIVAGNCAQSVGMYVGSSADVVNNHIEATGRTGGSSDGVFFVTSSEPPPQADSVFLNNTVLGGVGATGAAFYEYPDRGDPAQLRNNNLFGGAALYLNDGTALHSIGEVNAMTAGPAASGNISADPQVTSDWHLQPTSPNRGAGAATAGTVLTPETDRDGDARPIPSGTNPDIGPDERD